MVRRFKAAKPWPGVAAFRRSAKSVVHGPTAHRWLWAGFEQLGSRVCLARHARYRPGTSWPRAARAGRRATTTRTMPPTLTNRKRHSRGGETARSWEVVSRWARNSTGEPYRRGKGGPSWSCQGAGPSPSFQPSTETGRSLALYSHFERAHAHRGTRLADAGPVGGPSEKPAVDAPFNLQVFAGSLKPLRPPAIPQKNPIQRLPRGLFGSRRYHLAVAGCFPTQRLARNSDSPSKANECVSQPASTATGKAGPPFRPFSRTKQLATGAESTSELVGRWDLGRGG